MGLISLAKGVLGAGYQGLTGTLESAVYREYFESGDMSDGVLMKRAQKIITDKGRNRVADDNLISNGSIIDVQPGQCMIIIDSGKIVDMCTVPGQYRVDNSTAPGLFAGKDVNKNNGRTFWQEIGQQWLAGGQRTTTQRVFFINMGELINTPIKWGCGSIAFHHTQTYRGSGSILELDMTLKGNGEATIQIINPTQFFMQIGAQKVGTDGDGLIKVTDDGIYSNLKSGIVDHISSAIETLGYEQQVPYTAIKSRISDVKDYLNKKVEEEWVGKRGFGVANITVNGSFIPSDENKKQLEEMQASFNMSQNVNAMNYDIQKTMASGFKAAGENGGTNGAMGFGLAMGAMGGGNFGNIQNQPQVGFAQQQAQNHTQPQPEVKKDTWKCKCGTVNEDTFCRYCGSKRPENGVQEPNQSTWTCECGKVNAFDSLFCPSCGKKKPVVKKYKCDKCGWEPAAGEGENTRFCPKCGDPFNDADITEE